MALIRCKTCGAQVSDRATACPNCGTSLGLSSSVDEQKLARQRVARFLMANGKYLPESEIPRLRESLSNLSKDEMLEVECISFRNPVLLIILSFFFGTMGVDRFVLGDVKHGVGKLLLWVLWVIFYCGYMFALLQRSYTDIYRHDNYSGHGSIMMGIVGIFLLGLVVFVFWLIDLIRISGLTKKYNARKIYNAINQVS